MRRSLYILIIVGILLINYQSSILAQGVELSYQPVSKDLTYKIDIFLDSIVDAGSSHVSTKVNLGSVIKNQISEYGDNLILKMTFKDIQVNNYERQLKILNNDIHKVGLGERTDIESTIRNAILYKWINLVFTKKGVILEKYHSSDLGKLDFFDLTRMAEQFFIMLPDQELEVGENWFDTYTSIFSPYDQGEPFLGVVTYTYLGQEEYNGITCNKLKAVIYLHDERSIDLDSGMTKVTWISLGTLYFAQEGNYLVESKFTSDLSMLVEVNGKGTGEFRNYIQTGVQYNIKLINEK